MKPIFLFIFLLITICGFAQHKLILGKGVFKTKVKENGNIEIVSSLDTFVFNQTKFISIDSSVVKVRKSNASLEKSIPLKDIKEISYKISKKEPQGCEGCVFFPILIVASPFISMNHGRIESASFIPLISISTGLSFLIFNYYRRRNIQTYYAKKKQITFR